MLVLLHFSRRYLTRYALWYAAGIAALVATNWLSVTIPLYLGEAIDALKDANRTGADTAALIAHNAGVIAAMGLVIMVVRTLSRVLFFTPGRFVEAEVKRDLFAHLLRHQPAFLRQWPTGDLVSRASSDVNYIRLFAGFGTLQVVNSVVALGLTVGQMLRLSPELAGWTMIPVAVGLVVVQVFIQRMFHLVHAMQEELAKLSDHILSSYQGVATIQGFVAESEFFDRFAATNRSYLGTSLERAQMRAAIGPTLSLAASINVFVLLFVGGPMAIRGDITVGELVAFTTLVAYLTGPLRSVSFLLSVFKQAQAAVERIQAVMAPEPDRPDLPDPAPAPSAPPTLTFTDLTFAYPDEPDTPVLHRVSATVPAGGTLGILGPTGAGKSTLTRCLARLYNPPRGTVFVDGVDILDVDLDAWRETLAYVPQRAFLFSESLQDNILLGNDAPDVLDRALSLSAMDVDVDALPQGVDTLVGEAGVMLSGGQRQRAALARGLARPHTVLVLDDVLSAVDHGTEQELIRAIRSPATRPTTIIVANRISALQHADRILVLEHGRVVDAGTHDALVARPGLYRETWERQSEGDAS